MPHARKEQTSERSPIRVDFLPAELLGLPGRIGMTFAPGKKDDGRYGLWHRDLDMDLARLRNVYRTAILVSLIEEHELAMLGISDLFAKVKEHGLESVHLSVRDASVPALEKLVDLVGAVLDAAREGKNVVVHCRGGLGRTGLVAACCLVARGVAPAHAVRIVRSARARTIETPEQEGLVSTFASGWRRDVSPVVEPSPQFSRFAGCLLAGALGDALGYPIEFEKPGAALVARYGVKPPADLRFAAHAKGIVSDDTQMTLFTAEGIIRSDQRHRDRGMASMPAVMLDAYRRWLRTQTSGSDAAAVMRDDGWLVTEPRLHTRRAPGNTCLGALGSVDVTRTVSTPPNDSKGCGAVMRSAPFGLAARTREDAFCEARDAGVLTHGHPSGYLSAAYFASLVFDVARGASLDAAMSFADDLLAYERGNDEMRAVVSEVRRLATAGPPSLETIERFGEGWVGEEALGIALLCVLTAPEASPEGVAAALWRAVLHGGDSDSTGSIAGNLLGAMHGVELLPARWIAQVELRDVLERIARDLYACSVLGAELDRESYPPR